ncbi:MAG: polysaccharide deacetylase family protein [Spirosomataceae bacterium]
MTTTQQRRKILLTFDVEEFDTAVEYNNMIELPEQLEVSTRGMVLIKEVLEHQKVPATLFVTANYALHYQELIKEMSGQHEVASHGYWHGTFEPADLASSKKVLEEITGKTVTGFRRARMMPVDENDLIAAGYTYNSSLNPTFLPGRYNHLDKPKLPFVKNKILNIPASVSPTLRLPLFWLSFKNFPMWLYKQLSVNTLREHGFLNIYFHPWEFTDLSSYQMPDYVRRYSKDVLIKRLDEYITWLKTQGEFVTMGQFANEWKG